MNPNAYERLRDPSTSLQGEDTSGAMADVARAIWPLYHYSVTPGRAAGLLSRRPLSQGQAPERHRGLRRA